MSAYKTVATFILANIFAISGYLTDAGAYADTSVETVTSKTNKAAPADTNSNYVMRKIIKADGSEGYIRVYKSKAAIEATTQTAKPIPNPTPKIVTSASSSLSVTPSASTSTPEKTVTTIRRTVISAPATPGQAMTALKATNKSEVKTATPASSDATPPSSKETATANAKAARQPFWKRKTKDDISAEKNVADNLSNNAKAADTSKEATLAKTNEAKPIVTAGLSTPATSIPAGANLRGKVTSPPIRTKASTPHITRIINSPGFADLASIYGSFHNDAATHARKSYSSLDDIDTTLLKLGSINTNQLAQSWVAYHVILAAQDNNFQRVINQQIDLYGKDWLAQRLTTDPTYIARMDASESARQAVKNSIRADGQIFTSFADRLKQTSYDLQDKSWAKRKSNNNSDLTAQLRTKAKTLSARDTQYAQLMSNSEFLSSLRSHYGQAGAMSIWNEVQHGQFKPNTRTFTRSLTSSKGATKSHRIVDAVLALASKLVVSTDSLNKTEIAKADGILDVQDCFEKARLDLHQCVAASHFNYEKPFCVSQHVLNDMQSCTRKFSY